MNPEIGALGAAFLVLILGVVLCAAGNARIRRGQAALVKADTVREKARSDWHRASALYEAIRDRS